MKPLVAFLTAAGIIIILASPAMSNHPPVPEPPLSSQVGWDLAANGMLYISYDLDHNGKPDYFTLRPVITSFFSKDSVRKTSSHHPFHILFFVNYNSSRFYYVVQPKALFYGFDIDEDGELDILYKDVLSDGVNGNEKFYDSPSGKYSTYMN